MQIEQGSVVKGKVTGLTDFGAFVEIEGGKTGMVHISEVSTTYVKDIKDHLQIDQEISAMVISVSPEGKIALSIKKLAAPQEQQQPRRPRQNNGERFERKPQASATKKPATNVVDHVVQETSGNQSFEDMMAKFKQISDEKMTDLKRSSDSKRSGGYSRRGGRQ